MSEGWNIAVLGATGAVGEALLETLAERQFPVGIFMRWRAMKARVNICVLAVSR
jgi:aspartate-semialdehyde dehydrogenase